MQLVLLTSVFDLYSLQAGILAMDSTASRSEVLCYKIFNYWLLWYVKSMPAILNRTL